MAIWDGLLVLCYPDEIKGAATDPLAQGKLASILRGVRDGERFLHNIDMEYTEEFVLNSFDSEAQRAGLVKEMKTKAHVIIQDGCLRFEEYQSGTVAKGPFTDRQVLVSNGKVIRYLRSSTGAKGTGSYANIITDEKPNAPTKRTPLNMGRGPIAIPLSQTLQEALRGEGPNPDELSRVSLEGDDAVDGIACVRIRYTLERKQKTGRLDVVEEILWLAPENHYIPVKKVWLWSKLDRGLPDEVTETSDWREVEPGVKLPFKSVTRKFFKEDKFGKSGEREADAEVTTTVTRLSLRPAYKAEYFEDLPFPKGAYVYVVKAGSPVDMYIEGEPRTKRDHINWSVARLALAIGGVLFILAASWKLLRLRRKTRLGTHQKTADDKGGSCDI
ncbi:MAG: hypothetical protein NZM42_13560 [Gemmatales bacterium]|nr:hypothetical protein [Gemmatales bacterium]